MPLNQSILNSVEREFIVTRKALERIPAEKFNWRPHEKSPTMGELATHIATLSRLVVLVIEKESFDVAPGGGQPKRAETPKSIEDLLNTYDGVVAQAKAAISKADDEHLMKEWSLLGNGHTVFTLKRVHAIENLFVRHLIHHRGQLTVYMRLNDILVPSIYGPSADENVF